MWTLYTQASGDLALGLGTAWLDAAPDDARGTARAPYERSLCLQSRPLDAARLEPSAAFHARHSAIARVRVVMPEDEPEVLAFGFDAWGEGRTLEAFIASYETSRNHLRGTRYLLEDLAGEPLADLNTLRFRRGLVGVASVATAATHRRRGHATRLLRAVMALMRDADPRTRFGLFSEVDPSVYEAVGFARLPAELQRFVPAVAMVTDLDQRALDASEAAVFERYF